MRYERLRRVGDVEADADGGDGGYALAETEMTVAPAAQMAVAAAMQAARTTKEVTWHEAEAVVTIAAMALALAARTEVESAMVSCSRAKGEGNEDGRWRRRC